MMLFAKQVLESKRLPWYIMGLGVLFRLYQFICNKSLWVDEAALSLNILNKTFLQLLGPLDYNQYAPVGFLFLAKGATLIFGSSEYALRLIPLLSGIISLPLFYYLAKQVLKPVVVPIATAIFTFLYSLIYYSVEVKQYSVDVMVTLIIYLLVLYVVKGNTAFGRELDTRATILLAVVGGLASWFSHPSVFVMAGVGTTLILFAISRKQWKNLIRILIVSFVWLSSFIVNYLLIIRAGGGTSNKEWLLGYWGQHFAPFPTNLEWYYLKSIDTFKSWSLLGIMTLPEIWALIFVLGSIALFIRKKGSFFFLALPILFTLIASGLHLYPFYDRFILFLIPAVVILISGGLGLLIDGAGRYRLLYIPILILTGFLLLNPFINSKIAITTPIQREEIRPVLEYIKDNRKEGDVIYIYVGARLQFLYYLERYGFELDYCLTDTTPGGDEGFYDMDLSGAYDFDIDKIMGKKRVWVLFSHVYNEEVLTEMDRDYLAVLDKRGTMLDSFQSLASIVYLYDLSGKVEK